MTSNIVHTNMNYMKKQTEKQLAALSGAVGDFIRYWGFRRIHGEIWTQIYLTATPLSGVELTERLGVSKALVSPALKELEAHKLILVRNEDGKTKRYTANPDVFKVIKDILIQREMKLIEKALLQFGKVESLDDPALDKDRLKNIGQMINVAHFAIAFIVSQSEQTSFNQWADRSQNEDLE